MIYRLRLHPALALLACASFASALAAEAPPAASRFKPQPGFSVQEVVKPGSTGSLVAMAFNEAGDIIASREQGPLVLIQDKDHDGQFETVATYCDKVKNCQGILPLGDHVFAVGDGPSGPAFYRLTDTDADGQADKVDTLLKFKGGMGEHGPHAPVLGPDGLIYLMIGNHAFVEGELAKTSPHHHFYDAELFTPKYEDANGHASGIKAPGGSVVRTDANGSFLELFVGGFRNAYDHTFNRAGELFTYDSDMEWDVGLPWYRPTRVNHLIPGAEFGWRSGWSKWPAYFVDSLPDVVDTGRGSPTGVVFYEHNRFPKKYHDALFMCDWSMGRIVAVTMQPEGGTYKGVAENFLEGQPLNCSDIDVGPDGWLYICVGGRNTEGSILRVVADGQPLAPAASTATGIDKAIKQPQPSAAWARRATREVKKELGDQWGPSLFAVAVNKQASAVDRVRALDLMQLSGTAPSDELLIGLTRDASAEVRAKAVYLLGIHATAASNDRLVALLDDADPNVRRLACASLVRARHAAPADALIKLLAEPHPFVAWEARRALEELPKDQWQTKVLKSNDPRVFIQGAVALLTLDPDRETCGSILDAAHKWLLGVQSDDNVLDLLRVTELALNRGGFKAEERQATLTGISNRFPAQDPRVNRELIRTLVMLQDPTLAPRLVEFLKSNAAMEERIQGAMLARFLNVGWTPQLRSGLLDFIALARALEGGNSYKGYLTNGANDILKSMTPEEQLARIREGAKDPTAALGVVQHLSDKLTAEQTGALLDLDRELASNTSPAARELAKATIVALGHGEVTALPYLHEVFENAPDRRQDVAQALATYSLSRDRRDEDWPLLVRSLPIVEGGTARDVMRALQHYQKRNDKPQEQRQVILLGLKLGDQGGRDASQLLLRWTGAKVVEPREPWQTALASWQKWFAETYPDQPEAVLPKEPEGQQVYASVMDLLASPAAAQGDAARGAAVFEKAQCIKCHRYGTRGEGIGPDLTNVSKRFQKKEILESVVFPSLVISDQFAAKTVLTVDGQVFIGLVGETGDGVVVLQASGEKANVAKKDIEQIAASNKSAMPEGLFNTLTPAEIADLFAYMANPPAN
jgi:putative membrane-bound dehydrogenase-like protein